MKVLLVNPPRRNGTLIIREERCEIVEGYSVLTPYSLLQIGSLLEPEVEHVELIDANALNLSYEQLKKRMERIDYDVLIFKFIAEAFDNDMKVAEISKKLKPNAKTVGICYVLRKVAKEVMAEAPYLDIYIKSEYEVTTPNVIRNIKDIPNVKGIAYQDKGKIIENKDEEPMSDWDSLPIPAFHLLPSLDPYYISVNHGKPFSVVYTSKGCPYNCLYCNVAQTKLRLKSVDRIMKEIDYLKKNYSIKTISFFDETFTLDKDRVLEICKRIKEYKIKWYCNTRTNLVTPELLKNMREAGCKAISFGIESGSQKILDNASKRNTVEQNANAIKWASIAGIKTHCSFIFGLPGETEETINETLQFIRKTLPNSIEFNVATPYPGTRFTEYAKKNGLIKKDFHWRQLSQDHASFQNRELSNEYLSRIRKKAYFYLYLNPRWFFKNLVYVVKNPDDFALAFNYVIKIIKESYAFGKNLIKSAK